MITHPWQKVSFGVSLPTYCGGAYGMDYLTLSELRDWISTCERLGFAHLWHVDRLGCPAPPAYSSSWYEPMTTLAAITPYVSKARIGTAIINITYRSPVVFAKQAATLDRLSSGKLTLGLGQGWNRAELDACGVKVGEKAAKFEEAVEIVKLLLQEDKVSFEGRFWRLKEFCLEPRPVQRPRPPILIAGGGDGIHFEHKQGGEEREARIFRRIARLGDGWIARTDTRIEEIARGSSMIKRFLAEVGRSPEGLLIAHQNFVFVLGRSGSEDEAKEVLRKIAARPFDFIRNRYIIGGPKEVEARIRAEIEAGVQHFIVMPVGVDYEVLYFFADEIIPSMIDLK